MPEETAEDPKKETFIEKVEDFLEDHIDKPVEDFLHSTVVPDAEVLWTNTKALIARNGDALLMKLAADVVPLLVTMQWGAATAKLLADLAAAGVQLVEGEEQLAASTALQIAQAGQKAVASGPNAPAAGTETAGSTTATTGDNADSTDQGANNANPG